MCAWLTVAGLGAAVPYAIRSNDSAEVALYQAIALRAMQIKADAQSQAKAKKK